MCAHTRAHTHTHIAMHTHAHNERSLYYIHGRCVYLMCVCVCVYTNPGGPPGRKSKLQFHTGADTPDHWMKPAAAADNI